MSWFSGFNFNNFTNFMPNSFNFGMPFSFPMINRGFNFMPSLFSPAMSMAAPMSMPMTMPMAVPMFTPYIDFKQLANVSSNMNFNSNINLNNNNIAQNLNTVNQNSSLSNGYTSTKLFDENTKLTVKKVTNGSMPYLLIGPENVDPNEKLPVLVSLHGLYQKGTNPDLLQSKEYDPAVIMKKWNLKNFRGYIICPQLPKGSSGWCNKGVEQRLRGLLTEFQSTHNVDTNNISLIGFSLGGAGALYFANAMSDVFKKAVALSPYVYPGFGSPMKIPTKAYAGGRDDSRPNGPIALTNGKLKNILGPENCQIIPGKGHSQLPGAVFRMDNNRNGCSDVIEWLFS